MGPMDPKKARTIDQSVDLLSFAENDCQEIFHLVFR